MATYKTQIQRDFLIDEWVNDVFLDILIKSNENVVSSAEPPSAGTQVSWSGPDGNGNITFFKEGQLFMGSCREPYQKEPVGWRGQLEGWYAHSRDYI